MFRRAREGDGVRRARAKSRPSSAVPLAVRGVAAGLLVAVALGLGLRALWLGGCFLPSWVRWRDVTVELDLDGDGATDELCVERRKLSVSDGAGRACGRHQPRRGARADTPCLEAWQLRLSASFLGRAGRVGLLAAHLHLPVEGRQAQGALDVIAAAAERGCVLSGRTGDAHGRYA